MASFEVDTETQTTFIIIDGWSDNMGTYFAARYALPLVWGIPTPYIVTTWDELTGWITAATAVFMF